MLLRLALVSLLWSSPLRVDDGLIDFELRDQFDRTYTDEAYANDILIVAGGDRKGSPFCEYWGTAVWRLFDEVSTSSDVVLVGLADLEAVPRLLRSMVRKQFPDDRRAWVLLDWKGEFPEAYEFEAGHCNLLLFDATGTLVHQAAVREADPETLAAIEEAISTELAAPPVE